MGVRSIAREKARTRILKAALESFIRIGYGSTRVVDIAEKAGVSVGLIFHYFNSKEKLYEELLRQSDEGLDSFDMNPDKPLEYLEKIVIGILNGINSDPDIAKLYVLTDQATYLEGLSQEIREIIGRVSGIIHRTVPVIEKGQKEGTIREGNPEALATLFWTAIQGYAQHKAQYPESPEPHHSWFISILKK